VVCRTKLSYGLYSLSWKEPLLQFTSEAAIADCLRHWTARLRFLREARAAASVRHPNVASVFHLGATGQNYFYTMEFVEGETLRKLIKRSGRLEIKLALEVTTQVAAGLSARLGAQRFG
jgi:serine/threonine protein kinase